VSFVVSVIRQMSRPGVTVLEDHSAAMGRRLRTRVEVLIGTPDRAYIGGKLYTAVQGDTAPAAIREAVRQVRAADACPEHDQFIAAFMEAGDGVSPGDMVGEAKALARAGARMVLRLLRETLFLENLIARGTTRKNAQRRVHQMRGTVLDQGLDSLSRFALSATNTADPLAERDRYSYGETPAHAPRSSALSHPPAPLRCFKCQQDT
jgi:hypothetical protein